MSSASGKTALLVGTRKGGFVFGVNADRSAWKPGPLLFKGWKVMHMVQDSRNGRLYSALSSEVFGPSLHTSDDGGGSWQQTATAPAFTRPSASGRPVGNPDEARAPETVVQEPEKVNQIWHIRPGLESQPGVIYAGIEPAALFRSEDDGQTWEVNAALFDHPHRAEWFPGAGGLCLHSILLDPTNPQRMYLGISTGGCYRTDDGGQSWQPRNRNTRADFLPNTLPEYGQCLHKMALHPSRPERLYQQNHCGVYRSDNAGEFWQDIGEGRLPSRFGFPIAVHPHDPETIFIALEESDQYRLSVDGRFSVWRSRDGGESWERKTQGLPEASHLVVLREAITVDQHDPAGIYIGTSTGQIFFSRDDGESWALLADFLPPVLSVEVATV